MGQSLCFNEFMEIKGCVIWFDSLTLKYLVWVIGITGLNKHLIDVGVIELIVDFLELILSGRLFTLVVLIVKVI